MSNVLSELVTVADGGSAVHLRGVAELHALRRALFTLTHVLGYRIVFDPSSEPDLVDFLAVAALSTVERAAVGGAAGAAIGGLLGDARTGAALGSILGALVGFAEGVGSVERGVRVRATLDARGVPHARVTALG